ncbi:hypothetical protein JAO78_005190 [Alishewanella sp. 16-MA]|uniref:Uncharacterized protein n=1 Tax=Alishewanella maricola TaxID=2795740 RepID=A0ABS8C1K1_9ALTE|nr:hypothetical protein [Alishewanella maricola]MCB5226206.1 hypothetical protein [Alishewanella maricola]
MSKAKKDEAATVTAVQADAAPAPEAELPPVAETEVPSIEILKDFSASENGAIVQDYKAGELHITLPPVAANYAIAIGAVSKADAEKLKASVAEEKPEA